MLPESVRKEIITIIKQEVTLAIGCTEPIAVALAVALASECGSATDLSRDPGSCLGGTAGRPALPLAGSSSIAKPSGLPRLMLCACTVTPGIQRLQPRSRGWGQCQSADRSPSMLKVRPVALLTCSETQGRALFQSQWVITTVASTSRSTTAASDPSSQRNALLPRSRIAVLDRVNAGVRDLIAAIVLSFGCRPEAATGKCFADAKPGVRRYLAKA